MKKRNSEAIWIDSTSRWCVKVQKDGIRKSFYSSTPGRRGKHEAENKADAWLESGTKDMRFEAAWKLFMDYHKENASLSAVKKLDQYGRLYIVPNLRLKKLSAVTPLDWQSCIDAGAKHGLSQRSCVNIRATITKFIKYARKSRWDIQRLEEGDITIPTYAKPTKEKSVLQPDAIKTLFDDPYIIHHGKRRLSCYSYAFQFLVVTGLRRGELCGLKNEDITTDHNNITTITISRSINEYGEETTGKNSNARRTIELSTTAAAVLQKQRDFLKSNGIISPWVFPDQFGECPHPNSIYDHWRSWCKQHNVSVSLHELRHTFISINKSDLPLELMKATVGHSSSMDTYGIYGHTIEGDRHRAAQIVSTVFEKILTQTGST